MKGFPHAKLGPEFLPLLTDLRAYFDATMAWQDMDPPDKKSAEAKRLVNVFTTLAEVSPQTQTGVIAARDADLACVEGMLRAMHLKDTVVPNSGILDTVPTKTLAHFVPDFSGDPVQVRNILFDYFGISEQEAAAMDQRLEKTELIPLQLRMSLVELLSEPFTHDGVLDALGLFGAIFPGVSLDVEPRLIRTSTGFMFCVPFADVESLKDGHPRKVFHSRVKKVRQRDMVNFPAFGPFRGEQADETLIRGAAKKVGLTYEACCDIVSTMVTVLTLEDVDKYIVHDVWGHQWQALLFAFEDTYQGTAGFVELPPLKHERCGHTLESLIRGPVEFDAWEAYLTSELSSRIITTTSGLFAEVLADVIEHKFLQLRPELAHLMPSSSFLKMFPAKLDLTLHDLPLYVRFAVRSFQRLVDRENRRSALASQFLAVNSDVSEAAVGENIATISEWTDKILANYDESYAFEQDPTGTVDVNVIGQFALQFFAIVVAFNEVISTLYSDGDLRSPAFVLPVDFFVFSVASFYEQDRAANFWKIDTFVRDCFLPRCAALQSALRG